MDFLRHEIKLNSFHNNEDGPDCIKKATTTLHSNHTAIRLLPPGFVSTSQYECSYSTLTPVDAYLCRNLRNASESKDRMTEQLIGSHRVEVYCCTCDDRAVVAMAPADAITAVPSSFDQELRKSY